MVFHYCKLAWRNLTRNKLFSFINIFGLALSLSIGLMALIQLKEDLGYDQFHPHPERSYRIISRMMNPQQDAFKMASTPVPLGAELQQRYGFIESATTLYPAWKGRAIAARKSLELNTCFIQPSFFTVFGFHTRGQHTGALAKPNQLILSEDAAKKFFGTEDPIGKALVLDQLGTFEVADVLQTPEGKSHIDFDAYLSFASLPALQDAGINSAVTGWNPNLGYTYVMLQPKASAAQLQSALDEQAAALQKVWPADNKIRLSFALQKINRLAPAEEMYNQLGNLPSMGKEMAALSIALIILLSACFNYTNLAIARALKRAKEVGIRKVNGATRSQVFLQFITESVLLTLIALAASYILLSFLKEYAPFSAEVIPQQIDLNAGLVGWLLAFGLATGLLAGAMPAWILSSFQPALVLKNLVTVKLFGRNGLRKALTVIQFTLSLVTIIVMLVCAKQFHYSATADYGFNRSQLISIPLEGAEYALLRNDIAKLNGVVRVAAVSDFPGVRATGSVQLKLPGTDGLQAGYFDVNEEYLSALKLTLLAGRNFSDDPPAKENGILINETAQRTLQFPSPEAATGTTVLLDDTTSVSILGVVKDFHFEGFERPVLPMVLRNRVAGFHYLAIQTAAGAGQADQLVAQLQDTWKQLNPHQPFSYAWFDKSFYERKSATGTVSILGFLAFIAITIACLGLLGMVVYTTETKVKEVSIRKVIGASARQITLLLSAGFLKLIGIAILIALPIGWVLGKLFLSIFAVRVSLGVDLLLTASLSVLAIAMLVIASQVYSRAIANPVKGLRD